MLRITPAYAGKSSLSAFLMMLTKDHPRLCGEKRLQVMTGLVSMGSPPPMRGKESDGKDGTIANGITPAYAGKSRFDVIPYLTLQDHPRLCGEKLEGITLTLRILG